LEDVCRELPCYEALWLAFWLGSPGKFKGFKSPRRRNSIMTTKPDETIFAISRQDVINCAREMGLPEEAVTDELLYQVKDGVAWDWNAGRKWSRRPSSSP
jgi:hypothetical protein